MQINLLSDTVTKPTKGMLEAMFKADVGDDVFKADPTVNRLQEKVAHMFGMEDALFFPSGTMANQVAIKLQTQPGDQIICDKWAHVYNYEGGGTSFNSGASCRLLDGNRGMFTAQMVKDNVSNRTDIHQAITRLVTVENTTNKGGGACWDLEEIKKISKVCKENDLAFHLDGARLFNALIVRNEKPLQYGKEFDTISISLSKGLGCPVGSLLISSQDLIDKARRIRKLFGGGMRQIGYLAAAGIYSLDNHIERLADDHARAKKIADALKASPAIKRVERVETNIIIFYTADHIDDSNFVNELASKNILITGMGQGKLRMVTHLDFNDEMLEILISEIQNFR